MSLGPLYVFLGEVSVQVLCPFVNWFVCCPRVELCEFFIYFGDQILVQGIIGKHIFPYSWLPFYVYLLLPLTLAIVYMKRYDCSEHRIAGQTGLNFGSDTYYLHDPYQIN